MAKKNKTFRLGDSGVIVEVLPDGENSVLIRSGKATYEMKKTDLWLLLFTIADPDTQDKLMPVRKTQIMKFERVHTVQASKPIKKGELLTVKCVVDVDKIVRDSIANGTGGLK